METGNLHFATSAYGDFFLVDNIMVYIKGLAGHTKDFTGRLPEGHGLVFVASYYVVVLP
jgi:hypothetical protein